MLIRKLNSVRILHHHIRRFSAAAPLLQDDVEAPSIPPLQYIPGFPTPDPKYAVTIDAIPRAKSGRIISAKERKAGRVPSIVFEQEDGQHGGNMRLISVQNNQIKKLVNHMGRTFFLSRVYDLEVRPEFESDEVIEKVRVLPKLVCSCSIYLLMFLRFFHCLWVNVIWAFHGFSRTKQTNVFFLKETVIYGYSS